MQIGERRLLRTAVMLWLHGSTGGGARQADAGVFRLPRQWEGDVPAQADVLEAVDSLRRSGLLSVGWVSGDMPAVLLTLAGVREVESAVYRPYTPTAHLAPVVTAIRRPLSAMRLPRPRRG